MIGLLSIHLRLTGCRSLKEKRGRLQPLLHRLQREFNISTAEMDLQDRWQEALIACGMVGNERVHLEQSLQAVGRWVEAHWPDGDVLDDSLEII
jgi:uncharacterized protein YlxP (DUF503 family)